MNMLALCNLEFEIEKNGCHNTMIESFTHFIVKANWSYLI